MIKMGEVYDPTKPFNDQVRRLIQETHPKSGPISVTPFGKRVKVSKFGRYWNEYDELTGTDGIGTKGLIHWMAETIPYGVQDAFAMTADDLMEGGFEPVYLQDHLMMQEENESRIFEATMALRDLCIANPWSLFETETYPIVITGGETAIINTMQGFEMGITMTGYSSLTEQIVPNAKDGDVLIGLDSSGLHSNGYSFVRDEMLGKRKMTLDDKLPWNVKVGEELTIPTHVYTPALKELLYDYKEDVHGMVHITGGGLSKLKELAPSKDVDMHVERSRAPVPQNIFFYLHELGCTEEKMYTRFNNE